MTYRPQAGAPGKPVVVFQSKLKAWEPGETNRVIPAKSKGPREKTDVPTQATNKFSLLPPSVLFRPSINWRMPTPVVKPIFLVCRFKCSSSLETPSQTYPDMFY